MGFEPRGRDKGGEQLRGEEAYTHIQARYNFSCRAKQLCQWATQKYEEQATALLALNGALWVGMYVSEHVWAEILRLTSSPAHFTGSPPSAVTTGYWSAQPPAGSEDTATCWADVRNPPVAGITLCTSTHSHVEKKKKKQNTFWSRSPQHAELLSHGVERSAEEKVRLRYWKHPAAPVNRDPLQAECQVPSGLKWPGLNTAFEDGAPFIHVRRAHWAHITKRSLRLSQGKLEAVALAFNLHKIRQGLHPLEIQVAGDGKKSAKNPPYCFTELIARRKKPPVAKDFVMFHWLGHFFTL